MRTKLILTTAAVGLAGSLGAVAQVYSVNAVGYINVTVAPSSYSLVANQLNTGGNTVAEVLGTQPDGTIVFKYSQAGGFAANAIEFGAWEKPGDIIKPGEGFFLQNNATTPLTVTFVGEVPQGPLTTPLVAGLNLVASQVPQAGAVSGVLGYPAADGDQVFQWDTAAQGYKPAFSYEFGAWGPSEPSIGVGEGFFVRKDAAGSWTRNFSVN